MTDGGIAMEYVDAHALANARGKRRLLRNGGARVWTGALCAAIENAHARDAACMRLKPGLMVNSRGVVKVAEFGTMQPAQFRPRGELMVATGGRSAT